MKRRRSRNDLRKRNRLIARLTAATLSHDVDGDTFDALTELDQRAVAAARQVRDPHPVVTERPLEVTGGWALGGLYFYIEPVYQLGEKFLPNEKLNFGPLTDNLPFFLGKSAAEIFEYLLRTQRAASDEAEAVPTLDVESFFDGNSDPQSIAPNVVDPQAGPTFELIRDTLLKIAARRNVAAVGVEIHELPNPDHPGDDDMWLAAERVFVWTTNP